MLLAGAVLLGALAGCGLAISTPPTAPPPGAVGEPGRTGPALVALAGLPVKGRAPMTGYARDRFASAWLDTDRNGCDTRNDVLRRDLATVELRPGTHGCVVLAGTLADPYTGAEVRFVRGGASEVDVDHVVALGDAWATGAAAWPVAKRAALANDPLNLLAVDAGANRQKGDGDAATWLPRRAYRCAYAARQVAVKAKYDLWVTPAEAAALERVLSGCDRASPVVLPADPSALPTTAPNRVRDPGPPVS